MELIINDNQFLRQYETQIEQELVKIEYSRQDRKIFLTKLVMSEDLREKGFADIFIARVLDDLLDGSFRVVPTNPVIAGFMRKHKSKYKSLLPVGINI